MDSTTQWCGATGVARVDEIKPLSLRGSQYLAVKCVCTNFTGLPVFYAPVNQSSWGARYAAAATVGELQSPILSALRTCAQRGFEEPTFFISPDKFLHFLGHNHGSCSGEPPETYSHFYRPWPPVYALDRGAPQVEGSAGPRWVRGLWRSA